MLNLSWQSRFESYLFLNKLIMKKYLIILLLCTICFLTSCEGTYQVTTGTPVYTYYTPYYIQPPVRLHQYRPVIIHKTPIPRRPMPGPARRRK